MKITLAFLLLLIPFISKSQASLDSALNRFKYNESNKVFFEKILVTQNSKNEMFKNAQKWIAINYRDYKSVTKIADEVQGVIIYKGISGIKDEISVQKFEYTVELTFKDNKARLRLYDIGNLYYAGPGTNTPIEETLAIQKNRNDNDRDQAAPNINQQYHLFNDLLVDISKAIVRKDDF
ncbi:DUF4468 domain-containing protein [Mucilaginibacter sabulilitoris]|uniref:DUF4468 domain-containing protein n=1 Tax=Mucilaginibacter sabulilitoris TaxID=1173583 RepID=A0ABZ0TI45_9SPHI|nr:DUF4468 domain-containing protein [Mucilaginibacter sabulilitoris]WPU91853.1 DUF4468 domain-containing protein [Mucilaginibacter sabulilitoris]